MNALVFTLVAVLVGSQANAQTWTVRGQDPVITNAQQDHKLDLLDSLASRLIAAVDELTPRVKETEEVGASNTKRLTIAAADLDRLRATLETVRGEIGAAREVNDKLKATVEQCIKERDGYYRAYASCMNNPPCPAVTCPTTPAGRR